MAEEHAQDPGARQSAARGGAGVRARAAASVLFAVLPVGVYLVEVLIDLVIVNSGFYEQTTGVSAVAVWWVAAVPVIARVVSAASLLLAAVLGVGALRSSGSAAKPGSEREQEPAAGGDLAPASEPTRQSVTEPERQPTSDPEPAPGRGLALFALSSVALVTVVWLGVSGALDWLLWV